MERLFVPCLIVATSLVVWAAGASLGLPSRCLPRALTRMLETAGLAVGFVALNLAVGATAVIGVRRLAHGFASFYALDDALLPLLALLQALLFQAWRDEKRGKSA